MHRRQKFFLAYKNLDFFLCSGLFLEFWLVSPLGSQTSTALNAMGPVCLYREAAAVLSSFPIAGSQRMLPSAQQPGPEQSL